MALITDLFSVDGLCVAITGGASGIGLAIGKAMAENGATVWLLDHNASRLAQAAAELAAAGHPVRTQVVDATDIDAMRAAIDSVVEGSGTLDVMFANAGISGGPGFVTGDGARPETGMLENADLDRLHQVLEVNIGATFRTMQACVPQMKRQGHGRIIVTSSIAATRTDLFVAAGYVISKAGVGMLVKQTARELAAYGIRVNAIAPGPVVTNIGGGRLQDAAARLPFEREAPLGRIATPGDLVGAALFLASAAASHMTGAEIVVDGGASLGADRPTGVAI